MSFLPPQPTRFLGREDDLSKLTAVLQDPACRLATLVGAGGIGKTRLALEVSLRLRHLFANGVYFINLTSVTSAEFLASAIAKDLRISLFGIQDLEEQIINYLRQREILLILDNFEHLLEGVSFLTTLLDSASALKLLVTSREVLNLRQEWVWSVTGMQYPDTVRDGVNALEYGAVALFCDAAHRIRPEFRFEDEKTHVIRICQLVEGMPLAIELAASWLKALNCTEIASEIAGNMSFLNTRLRDLPERHRSIQVVFDQSWRLLTDEEQRVFSALSVFNGTFGREAAETIAGASLMTLSPLLDKSLIQRDANGRYQLHVLLRQYGRDKLTVEAQNTLKDRYIRYYGELLVRLEPEIFGTNQQEALRCLNEEIENAFSGWMTLILNADDREFIHSATSTLAYFYEVYGLHGELSSKFELVYHQLKVTDLYANQITLLTYLCWMYIGSAQSEQARTAFAELEALYQAYPMDYLPGHGTNPDTLRLILSRHHGDYQAAVEAGEKALQSSRQFNDERSEIRTLIIMASKLMGVGHNQEAYDLSKRAYEMALARGDHAYAVNCLINLAFSIRAMGDNDQALLYFEEAYRIRKSFNDPYGIAIALLTLADIKFELADYEAALVHFQEAAAVCRQLNQLWRLSGIMQHIGECYTLTARYDDARDSLQESLELASEINTLPQILMTLVSAGKWFIAVGQAETAADILQFVVSHPAATPRILKPAQHALEQISHAGDSKHHTLETAIAFTLRRMNALELASPIVDEQDWMLDPLTERELEVLRFLADGFTNQEIAEHLTVVLGTVKAHNHSIFSKLYVKNRVQAITRARELHLI